MRPSLSHCRWVSVILTAAVVAGCAPATARPSEGANAVRPQTPAGHSLTVAEAMRAGRDLGPVPPAEPFTLTVELVGRNAAELQSIIARGGHVSAADMSARFGPDPAAVARLQSVLRAGGLAATWRVGDPMLTLSGSAAAAERAFATTVHDFAAPDGTRFHAPLRPVVIPAALRPFVRAVLGFNNYPSTRFSTLVHPGGLEPSDIANIYDITPLYKAGLDGSGITVVFPEQSLPQDSVLASYAQQFGLPPFQLTVKTDPAWGQALRPGDKHFSGADLEAEMDIEIVHAIAPAAKEVVYTGAGVPLPPMYQAIARDFPNAVVSSSLGINDCETQYPNEETAFDTAWTTMAGEGTTAYDASGDNGAFCRPGTLGIYPDVASPNVTSVGATTIFQASDGGYGREAAWGDPVDQIGTGGGVSAVFPRPSWQQGNGVDSARSNGKRQVPDISAPGDPISPWNTITASGPKPGNGTSAAAPFWAGITALIYQDLAAKHLGHPGLMAPLLYTFAQQPAGIPNNPFHDISLGSNLSDAATPGWDFATGLGTPDVGKLADDIEWYETTHPGGQG